MKKITFATGNSRKIKEASDTLAPFGVEVCPVKVDVDEIQHRDPSEITKAKAKAAYSIVQAPVVVSDTSWEIPSLGGFPGGYMKDVSAWFEAEDWLALIARHKDRRILCHEHVAYFDGEELRHFTSKYEGVFIDEPRGRVDASESFEQVVVLYGGKTMAEYLEAGEVASAGEILEHWCQFGRWYSQITKT